MKPSDLRKIYDAHNEYWEKLRPEMKELKAIYNMRYFDKTNSQRTVETSRGYEMIESYVASLYTRDPTVQLQPDVRAKGEPEVAEATANLFLSRARQEIERATRMGLIYPLSYLKLYPRTSPDPLDRVGITSVHPWDIIVDPTASTWLDQRYVGHRYYVPLATAKEKYGNKKYSPKSFQSYFQSSEASKARDTGVSDAEEMVEIVEMYVLQGEDRMLVWSPDYANGDKYLYKGVKVQIGSSLELSIDDEDSGQTDAEIAAETVTFTGVPYRTASNRPIPPIIQMNYTPDPDRPLRGYSALRRVSDLVKETAILRSYQANAIRKLSRQWISRKGTLDDEAVVKLGQGVDGEVIEVELGPQDSLSDVLQPIPHVSSPAELDTYLAQIDQDFARGSILAPFSRGEATKATATEVTALAAYTSSEIGRHARERDAAIASIAQTYNLILALVLDEDSEVVTLAGQPRFLTAEDLTPDYRYLPTDTGSTAMSEAAKRQNILQLVPTLAELGVPKDKILSEIVSLFDLPESFKDVPAPEPVAPAPPETTPETITESLQEGVGPQNIQSMTPQV